MIESRDGQIYQWDVGRVVRCKAVDGKRVDEIHAWNKAVTNAAVLETWEENGWLCAKLPSIFLEKANVVYVYAVMRTEQGEITIEHAEFDVEGRKKPDDYVAGPDEILKWVALEQRMDELEDAFERIDTKGNVVRTVNGVGPDEDGNVVVDTVDEEQIGAAVDKALQEAKDSGVFDGKDGRDGVDGKDGKDGADGYTPQKGVDYFDGKDGKDGQDGYTPKKGVDYFDGQPGEKGDPGEPGKPGSDATVTAESIEAALGYVPADADNVGGDDVFVVKVENDVADKTYEEIRQAIRDKKLVYLHYGEHCYGLLTFATDMATFARIYDLDTHKIGCKKIILYFGESKLYVTKSDTIVYDEVDNELKELGTRPVANGVVTAKFIEVDKQINDLQDKAVAPIASERVVKTEQVFEENLVFEDSQAFSNTVCPIQVGNYYQLVIKKLNADEETIIVDQILAAVPYEIDGNEAGVAIVFDYMGVISIKDELATEMGVNTLVTILENNAGITDGELLVSVSKTVNVISEIEARLDNIVNEVIAALPSAEGVSF